MLGSEEWVLADVVAERDESQGIRSLELVPRDPSYPEAAPGQHIVVEGLIEGLRIRRPYTLSSGRRHGGRLRITVKFESGGAFSPWLFNGRPQGEPLRITRPRGDNVIDFSKGTVVCLVAGIGVTPALAAAATVVDAGPQHTSPLVIHYSARSRERMACIDELESAARRGPIELIVRDTSLHGRLDGSEVAQLAVRYRDANWYLCGPQGYVSDVGQSLRSAQIPDDRLHIERFTPAGTPIAANDEGETFRRYVLVAPEPVPATLASKTLRRLGKALNSAANIRANPLRWIEHRLARKAQIDAALPLEYFALVSALSWGPYQYQMQAFDRLSARGSANGKHAREAKAQGQQIPESTPDGDTFTYWMPAAPLPTFPAAYRVDTGWTRISARSFVPVYVTRGRTAIDHVLRNADHADRGAMPYHFFQQIFGRTNTPSCPVRKAGGLFGGQMNDNATWSEDRAFATELFGFSTIDEFSTGMRTAAEQTCAAIDQVIARDGNRVIDLNVMMSKVAYTIIVRAVFGNVDLAEMHELGRTLSESIRKALVYMWEFVLGRQSIPADYVKTIEGARLTIRRMVDLIRELERTGRLTETQRAAAIVRLIVDTAGEPDGAHDRLYTLILPIVLGGHETTGHMMTWSFYEMARDRSLEAELLKELEVFRSTRSGRAILTSDYDERPAAWALLAESLRRHAPFPATSRTTLHPGTVPPDQETRIGGFSYPSDAMVVISIIGIHLDPARWEDPYAFRIQRWFDGVRPEMSCVERGKIVRANIRAREQALDWLPFSDGPGRCLGQHFNAHEFFILLDALLPR
jgi:ferredoxin-NADP reductase/cytochrome P450